MRCPQCSRRLPPDGTCPQDGARAADLEAPAEQPEPLISIPGFEVRSVLGRGGFATVYAVQRAADDADFALKVARPGTADRLGREAAALERLRPPVVPRLIGRGNTAQGEPYLLLELLKGKSLGEWLASQPGSGVPPREEALALFGELCEAVSQVHAAGIVHRDIKPENVFLGGEHPSSDRTRREASSVSGGVRTPLRTVTLIDFGLAQSPTSPGGPQSPAPVLTRAGQRLGTPHYMAPEQCQEAAHFGLEADIYSLGIVLFELLTGRPPFLGDRAQILQAHVSQRPPRPSAVAEVDVALDEVVLRCLAKEPSSRFRTAIELRDSLGREMEKSRGPADARTIPGVTRSVEPRVLGLLGVRTQAPVNVLLRQIGRDGGKLAAIRDGRYVFAFSQRTSPADSVSAAARAARALATELPFADQLVVHATSLQASATETAWAGAALQNLDSWWIAESGTRVAVTEVAAASMTSRSEEVELPIMVRTPSLRGRGELLQRIAAEARDAWEKAVPTLTTIIGEVGHGKTRLLTAVDEELSQTGAHIIRVFPTEGESKGEQLLVRECFSLPNSELRFDDLQRACAERLPPGILEAAVPAIALALGVISDRDPRASGVLSAPGAARHIVAKSAAQALRRLAENRPVAIIVDDAHRASPLSLDLLEIATLQGDPRRIFVCLAGLPSLLTMRAYWGDKAGRYSRHQLEPLRETESRELLGELLQPIEFVAEPVLKRLEAITGGVPLSLVQMVETLRAGGAVRKHPGSEEWYFAGEDLLRPSSTPLHERLAQQILSGLTHPLQFLAQLCAIAGSEVSVRELDAAQDLLASERSANPVSGLIDPGVGLERLARAGLVVETAPDRYVFRHPLLRHAIEAMAPSSLRQRLHAVLLRMLLSTPGKASADRIAQHAEACGDRETALSAHFTLAEQARRTHRYTEAEEHYTAALSQLAPADGKGRRDILAGLGKVRYRIQRFSESLRDLRAARALAVEAGQTEETVDLLLEEATVFDWLEDWNESLKCVDQAFLHLPTLANSHLTIRCELARGRLHFRREEWEASVKVLDAMIPRATLPEDYESLVVGLILAGAALSFIRAPEESEGKFDQAISLCHRFGDDLHLGAACCARVNLWLERGLVSRVLEDLREARSRARQLGNAQLERFASYNLAQFLHWIGKDEEALPLAGRARELGLRFFQGHPTPVEALLLARILLKRGDAESARRELDWIAVHCPADSVPAHARALREMVKLLALPTETSLEPWRQLIARARRDCVRDDFMEILSNAIWAAADQGRVNEATEWIQEFRGNLQNSPLWQTCELPGDSP